MKMLLRFYVCLALTFSGFCLQTSFLSAAEKNRVDISEATLVVGNGELSKGESGAIHLLQTEVQARTGLEWKQTTEWPERRTVIVLTTAEQELARQSGLPLEELTQSESYLVKLISTANGQSVLWIIGHDGRGVLAGVGEFLRNLHWSAGKAELPLNFTRQLSPAYPIRGHQIGYRARANSWDAWTIEQFEQYVRDLVVFGSNSIENIPFQDESRNSMMKYERREFNKLLSEVCDRYDVDYWVWTPADFDLSDTQLRSAELKKHFELYEDCARLDGIFFPAGDPGENPPELVLPFLEELAVKLQETHPETKIWMSLQLLSDEHEDEIFNYIDVNQPEWLGGLVCGPSSMPIPEIRERLSAKYKFRLYPDITHNKLCQYIVPEWDPAFANTLGREAINPRPVEFAATHNLFAPYSDGFISYSDGVHDDVNKIIYSMRSSNPDADVREILIQYCRYFFDPMLAEEAADGILALEQNWRGSLTENGGVEGTLRTWQGLAYRAPQLQTNWRWQMNLVRACYDAYTRRRLIYETELAEEANRILLAADQLGVEKAMEEATTILNRTKTEPVSPKLRKEIEELCLGLFESIALQTSVPLYEASGVERGAFLDFIDYPLNNRWWYEDQFTEVSQLPSEADRLERLKLIATWENPGPGSFYDDIGNPGKSPHVLAFVPETSETAMQVYTQPATTYWWLEDGLFRGRMSWLTTMSRIKMAYEGLDPEADYTVRISGYGKSLLRMDGELIEPTVNEPGFGGFKEFPVPHALLEDRKLILSWDRPTDEADLNWRQRSRNAEVWLLKGQK
ncbi:MAG: hypothetical protein R3C11_11550 [Planctomycetaceae bacterium]